MDVVFHTRSPDIVTVSRALTEVGSTVNKPGVGPVLTSTSTEAAPSSLPSNTVNLNRYLKLGVRSPLGRVNRTNEVSPGLNTVNGVKPLRSTTAKPKKESSSFIPKLTKIVSQKVVNKSLQFMYISIK